MIKLTNIFIGYLFWIIRKEKTNKFMLDMPNARKRILLIHMHSNAQSLNVTFVR